MFQKYIPHLGLQLDKKKFEAAREIQMLYLWYCRLESSKAREGAQIQSEFLTLQHYL